MYTNAHLQVNQSTEMNEYNPGDQIAYECNDGFTLHQSIVPLVCFCSDNFDDTSSWTCLYKETTAAACIQIPTLPSKQLVVLFLCRAVLLTQ